MIHLLISRPRYNTALLLCRARAIEIRQQNQEAVGGFFSQIGSLYTVHHLWGEQFFHLLMSCECLFLFKTFVSKCLSNSVDLGYFKQVWVLCGSFYFYFYISSFLSFVLSSPSLQRPSVQREHQKCSLAAWWLGWDCLLHRSVFIIYTYCLYI